MSLLIDSQRGVDTVLLSDTQRAEDMALFRLVDVIITTERWDSFVQLDT